jgi:hypothetical protein
MYDLGKLIILFILFTIHFKSYSQDTIVQTNGTILKCRIQKADSVKVFFISKEEDDNSVSFINRNEIRVIKYQYIPDPRVPLSKSYLNIGFGYGPNYGILGLKSVIGIQNCGFLFGFGYTPFKTAGTELGLQLAIKWFYVNYGVAVVGVYKYDSEPYKSYGTNYLTIGCMLNLGKNKRMFIDLGIGFRTSNYELNYDNSHKTVEDHTYSGAIGIGYRFGKKSK